MLMGLMAQCVEWHETDRVKYLAISSSAYSFARTAHSFAHFAPAIRSAHSLAHSLDPELMGKRSLSIQRTRQLHSLNPLHGALHCLEALTQNQSGDDGDSDGDDKENTKCLKNPIGHAADSHVLYDEEEDVLWAAH